MSNLELDVKGQDPWTSKAQARYGKAPCQKPKLNRESSHLMSKTQAPCRKFAPGVEKPMPMCEQTACLLQVNWCPPNNFLVQRLIFRDDIFLLNKGVCHNTRALPFTLKSILRQKKNYGNSNISPCKNITNLQKNPLKETKILQDIIITLL